MVPPRLSGIGSSNHKGALVSNCPTTCTVVVFEELICSSSVFFILTMKALCVTATFLMMNGVFDLSKLSKQLSTVTTETVSKVSETVEQAVVTAMTPAAKSAFQYRRGSPSSVPFLGFNNNAPETPMRYAKQPKDDANGQAKSMLCITTDDIKIVNGVVQVRDRVSGKLRDCMKCSGWGKCQIKI